MVNTKLIIKTSVLAIIIVGVIGYSYYQARDFLMGPSVTILSPQNGAGLKDALVDITGRAKNISHIALNDRPISIDEVGAFSEKLLLSPGYNIMEITARDRFGRGTTEILELVLIN
ncbi:MAG: hypothetical protein NUV49_03345 [Patescibacteria group bacterium]|nr:hypothetical protein [Patescibacteria group bacterium]